MFELLGLLGCIALGGVWRAQEKSQDKKIREEYHRINDNTNYSRQIRLFALYQATGKDEQGNPLKEPHKHPKEIQRCVKLQLEKEGIRWYNEGTWNMNTSVFDKEGHIISINGRKIDPKTGRFIN